MSREVADKFVEALRRLEEERDVGALVEIHTEDCDVGSVSTALRAFQHATAFGLRLSAFQLFSKSSRSLLMSVEPLSATSGGSSCAARRSRRGRS